MNKIRQILGLDTLANLRAGIKQNNGIVGTFLFIFRNNDLKFGTFVGEDKYGNKYYENPFYFYLRDRWVVYNEKTNLEMDASMVPPEWHNWLHHSCDKPPTQRKDVNYKWMIDHTENFSGTNKEYVPYSTTKPKIKSWNPSNNQIKIGPSK